MARLTWTSEAASSIRDIYHSIARNRPETAQRTIESLLNKAESLVEYPDQGHAYRFSPDGLEIRVIRYGNFRIAFLIEEAESIVVLGVFHGLIFLPL
jgi:plasmid stabilization system protein ParE